MILRYIVADIWVSVYAQIDLKDAIITIKDGGSNSIEVKIGEGNLTWSERREIQYTLDRGTLDEVKEGDEVPVELRISAVWEYIKGAAISDGVPSIEDALKKVNAASDWVSTDADACRPYAVDVEITYTPDCTGDQEVILFSDYRYEQLDHDLRAGTIETSGRCNVTAPAATRTTQT